MKNLNRKISNSLVAAVTLTLFGLAISSPTAEAQNVSGLWRTSDGGNLMLSGDLETGVMGVLTGPNYTINDFLPVLLSGGGEENSLFLESFSGLVVISVDLTAGEGMEGVYTNNLTNEQFDFTATKDRFIVGSELDGFWVIEEEFGNESLIYSYTIEFFGSHTFLFQFGFDGSFHIYDGTINGSEYRGFAMFSYYERGIRFDFDTHDLEGRLWDIGDVPELGLDAWRDITGYRLF